MKKAACLCIAVFVAGMLFFNSMPANAETRGIAILDSVNGPFHMKSLGSYGTHAHVGMPVYHGDKIVTEGDSQVGIKFHDGSILEILPNTVVRITVNFVEEKVVTRESPGKKIYHFQSSLRREVRVFIGKIKFGYGEAGEDGEIRIRTMLVSPKAACELNGGWAWFGFDGKTTFKDQNEGTCEIHGDVRETDVPDVSAGQLSGDPNYKAALDAISHWKTYEKAKKEHELMRIAFDPNAYSHMSRTDKAMAWLHDEDQWKESGEARKSHSNLVGKLSEYARFSCMEALVENRTLKGHVVATITQRAIVGFGETESALKKIKETLERYEVMKKSVNKWAAKRSAAGKRRHARGFTTLVIATLECMSTYEKYATAWMLTAEIFTSGVRGAKNKKEIGNLQNLSKECKTQAETYYNKTRIYINTALSADKDDVADSYLTFGRVTNDITTSNSAAVNLIVTCLETIITDNERCKKHNIKTAMEELWECIEAKDELVGFEERLEVNYKSKGKISIDRKIIDQIMRKLESSANLCAVYFYQCLGRISIVLSLPPKKKCPEHAPHRCEDGSCVTDERKCGCPPDLIRCWDDTCVEDPGLCPCPKSAPFPCEDGRCVRDPSHCDCPPLTPHRCYDGRCVPDPKDCFDDEPPPEPPVSPT